MPLKNPSTNPVQAQTTKALMKKNYNIPKRRTKPLQKHKNDQTIKKIKKGRKTLQNLLPLITNNPDMSVSLRLDHQTQNPKPFTSSGLHRTPPNPSSQEPRRPSITSEFQWTGPNPSPKEKRRPPPIIYRSRDDSEAIPNVLSTEWIKNEFKKDKFGLKAHCYGKAEDFMNKILRGEVFIDPKTIKFVEHRKFKALTKITGQDSY